MEAKDIIRPPDPRRAVRAELREVLHDWKERPHVFQRVKLTGWYFRTGAYEYSLLIGDVVSRFTRVTPDSLTLYAYFDRPIPEAQVVTLVYDNVAIEDFPISLDPRQIPKLDRARIAKDAVDPFR